MTLRHDPETDSLAIDLSAAPGAERREIADFVVADISAEGALGGLDIDIASTRLDLTTLEPVALPLAARPAARPRTPIRGLPSGVRQMSDRCPTLVRRKSDTCPTEIRRPSQNR